MWGRPAIELGGTERAADIAGSVLRSGTAVGSWYKSRGGVTRHRIVLEGVVQGVGFRPFVKRLADGMGLPGITFNTAGGLIVEIDSADEGTARSFLQALRSGAPRAARIERCVIEQVSQAAAFPDFRIAASSARDEHFTLISPDLAMCAECAADIADPTNRRFEYPFTNCTNCGPRYSIVVSTPYDRANTTMQHFALCARCTAEYSDPADRRFHAEPVACPQCGPQISMALRDAVAALEAGQIVALKGLGGFQLACDAFHGDGVDVLRVRKRRSRKPFAVMMRDLATVDRFCIASEEERSLLLDAAAPVVLLSMRKPADFPLGIAPGLRQIGVMLPYTPLHKLLFTGMVCSMVMTSGNLSDEPIVTHNEEAIVRLSPLADRLLMHDRDIFMRVDDSVARTFGGAVRILRRARGYAPSAIPLWHEVEDVLGTGAELKNTFCITKGRYAIPSQHIGDLDNYETLQFFEETLRNLLAVYQAEPRLIAHDLHPDFLATRWALNRPESKIAVQHHHAHIASCMAENGVDAPVIGVAFDGAGFGDDGQIWGGEFLLCDYNGYRRCAHLRYVAQPGGDRAAREGWRMAAAHLYDAWGAEFRRMELPCWQATPDATWRIVKQMITRPVVRTSSCGRLFDAVAAICGMGVESSYEGESAMLLEAAAQEGKTGEAYPILLDMEVLPWKVDTRAMLRKISNEIQSGTDPRNVARRFHDSVALMIDSVCRELRERNGVDKVCLSGGVFQNFTVLAQANNLLKRSGFQVFVHSQVPPNDGGISLGQAVIGAAYLERQGGHVSRNPR